VRGGSYSLPGRKSAESFQLPQVRLKLRLLSLLAASRLLGIDPRTLKRAVQDGSCPAIRLGGRWKIEQGSLYRWLQAGQQPPVAPTGAMGSAAPAAAH
jgi:excisionase family DNA binding protein